MKNLLREKRAEKIRNLYARGGITQKEIAEAYGIHKITVHKILSGKTFTALSPNGSEAGQS